MWAKRALLAVNDVEHMSTLPRRKRLVLGEAQHGVTAKYTILFQSVPWPSFQGKQRAHFEEVRGGIGSHKMRNYPCENYSLSQTLKNRRIFSCEHFALYGRKLWF